MADKKSKKKTTTKNKAKKTPVKAPVKAKAKPKAKSKPQPQQVKPKVQMKPVKVKKANDNVYAFAPGQHVVYPAHGVGQIEGVETHTIAGMDVSLYAISFEKDRMRLKIPVQKAEASGLRKLCTGQRLSDALATLKGRSRVRRTMWSRRAQEYETKINSGDPISIAEVLRDLKRSNDDNEQSYSERQIYQSALERLAREVAAIEKITEAKAAERLETMMGKKKAAQQDNEKRAA